MIFRFINLPRPSLCLYNSHDPLRPIHGAARSPEANSQPDDAQALGTLRGQRWGQSGAPRNQRGLKRADRSPPGRHRLWEPAVGRPFPSPGTYIPQSIPRGWRAAWTVGTMERRERPWKATGGDKALTQGRGDRGDKTWSEHPSQLPLRSHRPPSTLAGAGHVWLPALLVRGIEDWGQVGWGCVLRAQEAAGCTQHTKDTATRTGWLHSL